MPIAIVRPDSDVAVPWVFAEPQPNTFDLINDAVEQPTAGDGSNITYNKNDDGEEEIFGFTSIANVATATQVVLWIYGYVQNDAVRPTVRIKVGSEWQPAQGYTGAVGASDWTSYTFGSLTASQADLDGLQVGIIAPLAIEQDQYAFFDVVYAVVTYSEPLVTGALPTNLP